jgi:vancomycin resistance protein YoaR
MGIRKKIGHGESNFRGSPKNRIHNIHNAAGKFEGVVVPPGETFSFVKNLGPVDASTGYKEELVIKNHKTIPEFGGGVCQVSTTLFRAAVNTGLKITERRNHAYPVQYYAPQGTDATVYIPKPDLQFINDTPGYILIQPYFQGTILSFDIFGTSDGRQVETEGPILLKRTSDGGKKYVYYQIIKDKDGNQLAKNGFWSFYQNAASFHDHQPEILTSKPKDWSGKEWKRYKREHGM